MEDDNAEAARKAESQENVVRTAQEGGGWGKSAQMFPQREMQAVQGCLGQVLLATLPRQVPWGQQDSAGMGNERGAHKRERTRILRS